MKLGVDVKPEVCRRLDFDPTQKVVLTGVSQSVGKYMAVPEIYVMGSNDQWDDGAVPFGLRR